MADSFSVEPGSIEHGADQAPRNKRLNMRRLLWPGVMTLVMLLVLLALGSWQVRRLHWKEAILARIAKAEASPAEPLSGQPDPFTKVKVTGRLHPDLAASYGAELRDLPSGPTLGSQLIEPLEREGSDPVLVDLGWIPSSSPTANVPGGTVTVEGYLHPPNRPGLFSVADDPTRRQFYTLDPAAIGAALGLHRVAPFVLVAMGDAEPDHFPAPAQHLPRPPNNHLSYAITWYGLAVALVVIFASWARKAPTE
jgi:surfeit locus 1 family protein